MSSLANLPFSQACENNKTAILEVLQSYYLDLEATAKSNAKTLVEFGSGTGQHAVHFAQHLPQLKWQATDLSGPYLDGCTLRIKAAELPNLLDPLPLDVMQEIWPLETIEAAFTANTLHIMSWESAEHFFTNLSKRLTLGALFICYGPFNYQGKYTSESNADFDIWLKQRDQRSGIRDFEALEALAKKNHLELDKDITMPANNRILVWKRVE